MVLRRDDLTSFNILNDHSHSQLVTVSVAMIWNKVVKLGKNFYPCAVELFLECPTPLLDYLPTPTSVPQLWLSIKGSDAKEVICIHIHDV